MEIIRQVLNKSKVIAKILGAVIGGMFLCCPFYENYAQNLNETRSMPEIGLWTTKAEDGVFQIYKCGKGLCGKFVGMQYKGPVAPVSSKGTSQCNFLMLRNFIRKEKSKYWVGKIIDPRNEKIYDAKIWIDDHDQLKIRGFMGISLFGETHVWHRYNHVIDRGCRIK